ncbi:hypothetical protein EOM39_02970 [Candidatus Gracilibacteria bacterium]|nr:hypothetical protein [Candidatus Gracilibacteria bacterium]
MKKQYIFIFMIAILFYMLFLVFSYKYKEYKINSYIEEIGKLNQEIKDNIAETEDIIDYKSTKAYKNKLLKQERGMKGRNEKVMYLTDERKYKKFTNPDFVENYQKTIVKQIEQENDEISGKSNFQKWIYFIFKK